MSLCSCKTHGFCHYNGIPPGYELKSQHNKLMAFTIDITKRFAMLKFLLYNKKSTSYHMIGLEMHQRCDNGIQKQSSNWFSCTDNKGVIVDSSSTTACVFGTHTAISYCTDKSISPDCVCCASTQSYSETNVGLKVGSLFVLKQTTSPIKLVGRCTWVGSVNNIDCIAGDLKRNSMKMLPMDFESLGLFPVNDRTILARQEDVTVVKPKENTLLNASGLIRHHQGLIGKRSANVTLSIGIRVTVWYNLLNMDAATQLLFGTVRWAGSIDEHDAVGIELDQPVADGFEKFVSDEHGFCCRPGCGVLALQADVEVDTDAYLPAFTANIVSCDTKLNYELEEDWHSQCVTGKQLRKDMKVFVTIEKDSRHVKFIGILRCIGKMHDTTVGIVEVTAYPELHTTLDCFILPSQETLLEWNKTQLSDQWWQLNHESKVPIRSRCGDMLLLVSVDYISKYSEMNFKEPHEEDCSFLRSDRKTIPIPGTVQWKVIDGCGRLYYGFSTPSSVTDVSDGTFAGQKLFQCSSGHVFLISAADVRKEFENCWTYYSPQHQLSDNPKDSGSTGIKTVTGCSSLMQQILKSKDMVPVVLDVILGAALQQENIDTIRIIVRESPLPINIGKNPTVLSKLVNMKWFEEVQSLDANCLVENNIDSHLIYAAVECLLHGHEALCHSLLEKCENKSALMENGESFLTHAIKNDCPDECLVKVMGTAKFDSSVCNKDGQTPTELACKKALSAFLLHVMSKPQCQPQVSMACPVCKDRSINTVLNCGHVLCHDCSQKQTNCHDCQTIIRKRKSLYLPK